MMSDYNENNSVELLVCWALIWSTQYKSTKRRRCLSRIVKSRIYLGKVDVSLFADEVGESSPNTSDGGHGEHDVAGAIDVGVLDTKDVLELVRTDESHLVRRDLKND